MQSTTISFLKSTEELLTKAFPDGIEDELYLTVLTIIEPELSDRNLALVISNITEKKYPQVLNDIYKVKSQPIKDIILLNIVQSLLHNAGFQDWLNY